MDDLSALLQCPRQRKPLRRQADGHYAVSSADESYVPRGGILDFLAPRTSEPGFESVVQDFYEGPGWKEDGDGAFGDTRAFVDTRPASLGFTSRCLRRLKRHFALGGKYLLDAGSGPIPHPELVEFGENFETRVCVDLSRQALEIARRKLGDRGVYLVGDLTNLPLQDDCVDSITCNHVIYQIPVELQKQALLELCRVLKPGGVAVVIGWWPHAPLTWRIERVVKLFAQELPLQDVGAGEGAGLVHNPFPRTWFEQQSWPFTYEYDVFRVVTNQFMKSYVRDDVTGRLLLDALFVMQTIAPRYCGTHGVMPAIVIRKHSRSQRGV
jgi:ubiquinone/menaquinone biosynthesis C-methylase UbiE